LHGAVFLVNSRYPLVCATPSRFGRMAYTLIGSSLSRSYGGILPSSLTMVLSIALVFSTCPPESVVGTGGMPTNRWAFLGSMGSLTSSDSTRHHVSGFRGYLSTTRPTRLPQDNHRLGSTTLLRPPSATVLRCVGSSCDSPLVPEIQLCADTPVLEYQPVVHRLRLAASP
jgi:hypothetical protein